MDNIVQAIAFFSTIKNIIMSIIYSLICKNSEKNGQIYTLCSYDTASGNYPIVVETLLKKLTEKQAKKTYSYNSQYYFHIIRDGVLSFVCMTDVSFSLSRAFNFLQDLKAKFKQKFTNQQIQLAKAHDLTSQFSSIQKGLMTYHNQNTQSDKKANLNKKLTDVKDILAENIDKILLRQQKVELFVKRAKNVDKFTQNIKKNASNIKKEAFWRNNKCQIFIGLGIVAILVSIFFFVF